MQRSHWNRVILLFFIVICSPHLSDAQTNTMWTARPDDTRFRLLAVSPEKTKLAVTTGGWHAMLQEPEPGLCYIFDTTTGKLAATLKGNGDGLSGVYWPSEDRVITFGFDGTVRAWDIRTGKTVRETRPFPGPVLEMAVSPNGQDLAVFGATEKGTALAMLSTSDLGKKQQSELPSDESHTMISAMCFESDEGSIILGDVAGTLFRWSRVTGQEPALRRADQGGVVSIVRRGTNLIVSWGGSNKRLPHGVTEVFAVAKGGELVSKWSSDGMLAAQSDRGSERLTLRRGSTIVRYDELWDLTESVDPNSGLGAPQRIVDVASAGDKLFVATDEAITCLEIRDGKQAKDGRSN